MKTVALARRTNVLRDFQNLKMARSPHAFIRGTTAQFYRWLDELKKGTDRSSLRWLGIGS